MNYYIGCDVPTFAELSTTEEDLRDDSGSSSEDSPSDRQKDALSEDPPEGYDTLLAGYELYLHHSTGRLRESTNSNSIWICEAQSRVTRVAFVVAIAVWPLSS